MKTSGWGNHMNNYSYASWNKKHVRNCKCSKCINEKSYRKAKKAFKKAKDYLDNYLKEGGTKQNFPYWDRFMELKNARNKAFKILKEIS